MKFFVLSFGIASSMSSLQMLNGHQQIRATDPRKQFIPCKHDRVLVVRLQRSSASFSLPAIAPSFRREDIKSSDRSTFTVKVLHFTLDLIVVKFHSLLLSRPSFCKLLMPFIDFRRSL